MASLVAQFMLLLMIQEHAHVLLDMLKRTMVLVSVVTISMELGPTEIRVLVWAEQYRIYMESVPVQMAKKSLNPEFASTVVT